MGYVYSSNDLKARLLKPVINFLYKIFSVLIKAKGEKIKLFLKMKMILLNL